MPKSFFNLILKKRLAKLCTLIAAMFVGALLEMLSISLVATVCSLALNQKQTARGEVIQLIKELVGIQSDETLLIAMLVALIALYVFKMIYLLLENWALARFVRSVQHEISAELYAEMMRAPYAWFLKTSAADVVNLLNTDTGRTGGFLNSFLQATSEGLVLLAIGSLLIYINRVMTMFVLVGVGLSFLLAKFIIKPRAYRIGQTRRKANTQRMKWLNQGVHGIKDVKTSQSEEYFSVHFATEDKSLAETDAKYRMLTKAPRLCIETILVVCVLLYILFLVFSGRDVVVFLPSLSAIVVATLRLLPTASRINSNLTSMNNMKPSVEAITAAMEQIRKQREIARPAKLQDETDFIAGVTVSGVKFAYEGRPEVVLDGIDIEIPVGAAVGIIGPSGAGKTTLIDILLGLLDPREGKVTVDGNDLRDCRENYLRQISYIPQNVFLLDDTVRNNVAFGVPHDQISDEQVWAALRQAELANLISTLPEGLDALVGENGIRLSGGERQRLSIARALYRQRKILVFDEATSALDPGTENAILSSIQRMRGKYTIVIISHRLSAVQFCDRIYRIEDGKSHEIQI